MNTIIKSTMILTLAAVFLIGVAGVTFAGHDTYIPEGAKVYENNVDAGILDDFGSAGTTFPTGDSMASENIKELVEPVSSSWY